MNEIKSSNFLMPYRKPNLTTVPELHYVIVYTIFYIIHLQSGIIPLIPFFLSILLLLKSTFVKI